MGHKKLVALEFDFDLMTKLLTKIRSDVFEEASFCTLSWSGKRATAMERESKQESSDPSTTFVFPYVLGNKVEQIHEDFLWFSD